MNRQKRPVDRAMAEDRSEKRTIRSLWVEEVKLVAQAHPNSKDPWYLTLSGADGNDIQLLIKEKLITLTEVDSIADEDKNRVVAVEQNMQAVAALQRRFIGLRIKEVDFRNLIRGEEPFRWPDGEDEVCCRAHVVNLDLNAPLKADGREGDAVFPVPIWIKKLCQLHAKSPRIDWTLCLTLHGEIVWPNEVNQWTKHFLQENIQREPQFARGCENFFGRELYESIAGDQPTDFVHLKWEDQQKIIMIMVPKLIARLVHNEGWRVSTERCLCYGGGEHAPMVTWIVRFTWAGAATATPDSLYRAALRGILSGAGVVNIDGSITSLA